MGVLASSTGGWRCRCLAFAVATAIVWGQTAAGADADAARPDFTGVWGTFRSGQPAGGPARRPPGFALQPLPFTPEGKRRSEEYQKLVGPEQANPAAYCTDYGMPTMMEAAGGYPIEFIQKPDQLTIIYEVEGETRRIYLGGRGVPKEKRLVTRDGYSTGHWEGDTLVVETTDLADGQDQRHPHSDQATILERFSLSHDPAGNKVMAYSAVMTDPVYYTEPIRIEKKFSPTTDGYIMTYRCPDEFWNALLDARRAQLKQGKPVTARMSDVYREYESK